MTYLSCVVVYSFDNIYVYGDYNKELFMEFNFRYQTDQMGAGPSVNNYMPGWLA